MKKILIALVAIFAVATPAFASELCMPLVGQTRFTAVVYHEDGGSTRLSRELYPSMANCSMRVGNYLTALENNGVEMELMAPYGADGTGIYGLAVADLSGDMLVLACAPIAEPTGSPLLHPYDGVATT